MEDSEEENDEIIDQEEEQDLSNKILRQYEEQNSNKKINLSSSAQTSSQTSKTKKKLTFQPTGSGNEADSESNTGAGVHNMSLTTASHSESVLHSTLREDVPVSTCLEDKHFNTVPETPDIPLSLTRYNSEQPRMKSKSIFQAGLSKSTSQKNLVQEPAG